MEKERQALRQLTDGRQCKTPVSELIGRINRHRRGWANYFRLGHPRRAFRNLNRFVDERLYGHLRRRSQRPSRPPADVSVYAYLRTLGLHPL
jgi:RNA-directed DNA polymerase